MTESVIDFPKNNLCQDIWELGYDQNGINQVWKLIPDVRNKILELYNKIFPNASVIHIIGSITSNQYTKNTDIDVHFLLYNNKIMSNNISKKINDYIQKNYIDKIFIKKHPIELYFQQNPYQEYMSVGCYDVLNQKWIVGPEFTNINFNPYKSYYQDVLSKSEKLSQTIRNIIFSIYEAAIVYKKNFNNNFSKTAKNNLINKLKKSQNAYDNIRKMRKVYSSPKSKEQAIKYKSSKKWKIADASFKLFDKYGYIAILKKFIEDYDFIKNTNIIDEELVEDLLTTVNKYINNEDKLSEQETYE